VRRGACLLVPVGILESVVAAVPPPRNSTPLFLFFKVGTIRSRTRGPAISFTPVPGETVRNLLGKYSLSKKKLLPNKNKLHSMKNHFQEIEKSTPEHLNCTELTSHLLAYPNRLKISNVTKIGVVFSGVFHTHSVGSTNTENFCE
jgi:hypothetical protein